MKFALRLPDYYKKEIGELKGDVSINQFIVTAVAEKIASLRTVDYLEKRAKTGDVKKGLEILKNVPDREPFDFDKQL